MPFALVQPSPRIAVSTFFAITGFVSATWIARIPALSDNLDLSKAQLGTLLLFIGIGSLVSFQLIGRIIEMWSSARAASVFGYAMVACLGLLSVAPNPLVLGMLLFIYGFSFGGLDVAMNAQGVEVERMLKRPIMGSLHGFFSLGSLVAAALSGLIAQAGLGLVPNFTSFALIGLVSLVWAGRGQIADPLAEPTSMTGGSRFALPPRALWILGIIAFCAAIGEGGMADWSALYIHDELGASEGLAALGFTMFSTTMLIGRFAGDRVIARFGAPRVIRIASIVSSLGLLIGLVIGTTMSAIVGFAVMGIGLSVVIPVVYSTAGSTPGIPSGRGVAAVATIGYSGFLLGPPALDWLAELTSLQIALVVIVLMIGIIAVLADALRKPAATSAP